MKRATASVWLALLAAAGSPWAAGGELRPVVLRPVAAPLLPLEAPDDSEPLEASPADDPAAQLLRAQRVFGLLGLTAQAAQRTALAADAAAANPLRSTFAPAAALRTERDNPIAAAPHEPASIERAGAEEADNWSAPVALASSADFEPRDANEPTPAVIENAFVAESAPQAETPVRMPLLAAAEPAAADDGEAAELKPVADAEQDGDAAPAEIGSGLAPFITTGSPPSGQLIVNNHFAKARPAASDDEDDSPAPMAAASERARRLAAAELERGSARPAAQNSVLTSNSSQRRSLSDLSAPAAPAQPQTMAASDAQRQAAPRAIVEDALSNGESGEHWRDAGDTRRQAAPAQIALSDDEHNLAPRGAGWTAFQNQSTLGPFEVIEQESEAIEVQVRRSKLLRTQFDIYRTAVVDAAICEVVQFTPREAAVIGKAEGATNVTFWFQGEQRPVTYLVRVTPDVEAVEKTVQEYELLEKMLAQHFPDSKVSLTVIADKVLVKGQAKDAEEAAQILAIVRDQANAGNVIANGGGWTLGAGQAADVLGEEATGRQRRRQLQVINMLRVPGVQQVALRVKIAELDRSAARGFGVDISGPDDGPAIINFSDNPDGSALFLQSLLNVAAGNAPALLTQFDGDDIQIGIRYLQQHGVLRLLSEPTLVTLSGRPATFVAGGEFAVPTVVGSAGLNAVTTDFRAFGVIISFMPTVLDKDRIRLQVAPEFSQVNSDLTVNDTPGLNVRAVTTTVEMREGQTLAIAGLLEDTMQGTNTGDIPFLAKLLGRRNMSRNETELLILVTPELVQPMEAEETPPLPGFDVTEPTNAQFFLHGDLEGTPTSEYRSTVWPRLHKRYRAGGPAMISGPFGHGQ